MLGRVAAASDDAPGLVVDLRLHAVADAVVGVGQAVDHVAEVAEARAIRLDGVIAPAGLAEECQRIGRRFTPAVGGHDAADHVFEPRHPQPCAELAGEPTSHADVVGVHVGDEDAGERLGLRLVVITTLVRSYSLDSRWNSNAPPEALNGR